MVLEERQIGSFGALTASIDALRKDLPVVVAISGPGGAGKTTLAEHLVAHFENATKLQLDNFLVNRGQGPGWRGGFDWERLAGVLADATAGRPLRYRWYEWEADALSEAYVDEPARQLVIVEGVRLIQPELLQHFDLTVWLDVPGEVATERGIRRDRTSKPWDPAELEIHIRRWHDTWVPKDAEYYTACRPRDTADFLYTDQR